ncbi:MAG TPA: hypothetical protein VJ792_04255 [Candidatus Nitrosotalea sp.]|nr:hypothetical protein [Candidatus Nitrosotalea sp.]
MKQFLGIHDWIREKQKNDPAWKLPKNTMEYLKGLENDLEELSMQLGVDLCLATIRHAEDGPKTPV